VIEMSLAILYHHLSILFNSISQELTMYVFDMKSLVRETCLPGQYTPTSLGWMQDEGTLVSLGQSINRFSFPVQDAVLMTPVPSGVMLPGITSAPKRKN